MAKNYIFILRPEPTIEIELMRNQSVEDEPLGEVFLSLVKEIRANGIEFPETQRDGSGAEHDKVWIATWVDPEYGGELVLPYQESLKDNGVPVGSIVVIREVFPME